MVPVVEQQLIISIKTDGKFICAVCFDAENWSVDRGGIKKFYPGCHGECHAKRNGWGFNVGHCLIKINSFVTIKATFQEYSAILRSIEKNCLGCKLPWQIRKMEIKNKRNIHSALTPKSQFADGRCPLQH